MLLSLAIGIFLFFAGIFFGFFLGITAGGAMPSESRTWQEERLHNAIIKRERQARNKIAKAKLQELRRRE